MCHREFGHWVLGSRLQFDKSDKKHLLHGELEGVYGGGGGEGGRRSVGEGEGGMGGGCDV